MWRRDKGFRVGTTRTRPRGQHREAARSADPLGAGARGRRVGALDRTTPRREARAAEQLLLASLRHSDAAVRRAARRERERARPRSGADRSRLRGDRHVRARHAAAADDRISISTARTTCRCPSRVAGATSTLTLCGDRRGRRPMHVVAIGGRDEEARERLVAAGFSVRPAKRGSQSWRYESCFSDFGRAVATVERIRDGDPGDACDRWRGSAPKSLPFTAGGVGPAGHGDVRRGRRLRRRRVRRARPARRAGLRPQRRGHAQLRRRRARHPQLDLRLPRSRHQEHPELSRTTTRTRTSSSWSRTTARRRRSWTPRTR